ncbi:flotillin domain-containing protein, partial [Leucobacter sp. M11]|uniref:flotillin domain-containing protein n=1 Tax=Leucobacter sp. M11 TaxID=2993565 RepID=UPI002D7FBEC6
GRAQAIEREGLANRAARIAAAEAIAAEGEAEARAIQAKGVAEANAVEARAAALETQSQAVLAQELIHLLPSIAAEYARAIGSIDNMTVVSADGASKVAGDAMGNIKGLLEMAKDTVGIDLVGMLNGVATGSATGAAAGRAARSEPAEFVVPAAEVAPDPVVVDRAPRGEAAEAVTPTSGPDHAE